MQEFDLVVSAIINQDQDDELVYTILTRLLTPMIGSYCAPGKPLCGLQEDMLHEIYLRVVKNFVPSFWNRKGKDGVVNRSVDYFCSWLRVLARNFLNDEYGKAVIARKRYTLLEQEELYTLADSDDEAELQIEAKRELLTYAFSIVLDVSSEVHIILTWLGMSLMILERNEDRIRVNQPFIDTYSQLTMYQMRDMLYRAAWNIDWLVISDRQKQGIDRALARPMRDGRLTGEAVYGEFIMAKGAKATISDWYYRMNRKIQKVIENETHNS